MAGVQIFPDLNGVAPSWADVAISLPIYRGQTVKTSDIAELKWSDKVDVGTTRGTNGGRKSKRTTGQYDCEASITFYKDGWRVFRLALAAKNKRLSLAGFDVMVQHTPPGSSAIHTVKIVGCRVVGRTASMAEGSDADKIEVPLNCMRIEEDGVCLL
jgi:hypothetical protein